MFGGASTIEKKECIFSFIRLNNKMIYPKVTNYSITPNFEFRSCESLNNLILIQYQLYICSKYTLEHNTMYSIVQFKVVYVHTATIQLN